MNKLGQVTGMAVFVLGAANASAIASTVTNSDVTAQTIIVIEGADRQELVIEPSDTISFCPSGCFVTMPNGDRQVLNGGEALTISGGKAKIK